LPGLAPHLYLSELSMSLEPEDATMLHPWDWWSAGLAAGDQVSGCLSGFWYEPVMQQELPDETAWEWLDMALAWRMLAVAGGLLACWAKGSVLALQQSLEWQGRSAKPALGLMVAAMTVRDEKGRMSYDCQTGLLIDHLCCLTAGLLASGLETQALKLHSALTDLPAEGLLLGHLWWQMLGLKQQHTCYLTHCQLHL